MGLSRTVRIKGREYRLSWIVIWLSAALVGGLLLSFVLSNVVFKAAVVPTSSMSPTLEAGDQFLYSPLLAEVGVERGDVVVFTDPGGWLRKGSRFEAEVAEALRSLRIKEEFVTGEGLVKRVIGVGGDEVQCCDEQGRILLNGVALEEEYVQGRSDQRWFKVKVPEGYVFVMGDNRADSLDSRAHLWTNNGGVSLDLIEGTAFLVTQPIEESRWLR